jgi:putative pyruvate formate lyase activating enzyme
LSSERLIIASAYLSMEIVVASYNQMPVEVLEDRAAEALTRLESCRICPRSCGNNRLQDELGFCRGERHARIYSYAPHFGEEAPLVGVHGSGTIFFSGCNMACVFCQNYEISQLDQGMKARAEGLATMMMRLQDLGCHNINFVSPTHFVPQILEALVVARERGLSVPLVYNSGGYDLVETLRLLEGIFDIYMPDAKYGSDEMALLYSKAPRYTHYMKTAILEMHRQVGDLVIQDGIATRGLLVRHLVLPGDLAGTAEVVRFLAEEVSKDTYLNVMAQYRPEYTACDHPELDRRLKVLEYRDAVLLAARAGLTRGLTVY